MTGNVIIDNDIDSSIPIDIEAQYYWRDDEMTVMTKYYWNESHWHWYPGEIDDGKWREENISDDDISIINGM